MIDYIIQTIFSQSEATIHLTISTDCQQQTRGDHECDLQSLVILVYSHHSFCRASWWGVNHIILGCEDNTKQSFAKKKKKYKKTKKKQSTIGNQQSCLIVSRTPTPKHVVVHHARLPGRKQQLTPQLRHWHSRQQREWGGMRPAWRTTLSISVKKLRQGTVQQMTAEIWKIHTYESSNSMSRKYHHISELELTMEEAHENEEIEIIN